MKQLLAILIALPLLLSTAFAGDFANFNFNFDWSGGNRVASFYSPFTSTIAVLAPPRAYPGTTGTFTRATAQIQRNDAGVYVSFASGIPATNSKGILIEPASTNKVTAYGIIPQDTLSAELITVAADRDFSSDTGFWSKEGSGEVTISGGAANWAAATGKAVYKAAGLSAGKTYQVTFTVLGYSSGAIYIDMGTGKQANGGVAYPANGTYTVNILADSQFIAWKTTTGGASTLSIDNVSIKELTWAVGTRSFHNGTAFVQNITGLTLSGDTAAVLSIVTDEAEITAAGLAGINPGFKVYKFDNSLGSVDGIIYVSGATDNVNNHSMSLISRVSAGTGILRYQNTGTGAITFANTTYVKNKTENKTPAATSDILSLRAPATSISCFLLPQLEESVAASSIIPGLTGSTTTRAASVLSYPVTGNIPVTGAWTMKLSFTPEMVSTTTTRYLWSSYTDASNYTRVGYNGVIIYLEKNVAGVKEYVTKTLTTVAGTTYNVVVRRNADGTFNLFVAGAKDAGGLGSELITVQADREFSSDTGFWSKNGADSSIASNVMNLKGDANAGYYRTNLISVSKAYQYIYTITRAGSGSVAAYAGTQKGTNQTATGTYTEAILCATVGNPKFYAVTTGTDIDLDNVSVKEIYNSTTATTPVLTTAFQVGSSNSVSQFTGEIKSATIWKKQLTDSRCITLAP